MKVKIIGSVSATLMRVVDMDDAEYQELRARLDSGDMDAPQEIMEFASWDTFTDPDNFEIETFGPAPNNQAHLRERA